MGEIKIIMPQFSVLLFYYLQTSK